MGAVEEKLAQDLRDLGNTLLHDPPVAMQELLNVIDQAEDALSRVEQAPCDLVKQPVLLVINALSSMKLLRHSDMNVKISTLSCILEIARITAPDAPFDDDLIKEIFQLIAAAFEYLSLVAGRCYSKAVSVLVNVSRIRFSLVMLDLECEEVIAKIFRTFLKVIRSNHPDEVFLSMVTFMADTLDESEEISLDLLSLLLASVEKENENTSVASWKLGNAVIQRCADVLRPYLVKVVQSSSFTISNYSEVVISIFKSGSDMLTQNIDGSGEHSVMGRIVQDVICPSEVSPNQTRDDDHAPITSEQCLENRNNMESKQTEISKSQPETMPKKRGRKPNRLMKPDEGYDNSWIGSEGKNHRLSQNNRRRRRGDNSSGSKKSASREKPVPLEHEQGIGFQDIRAQAEEAEISNSIPGKNSIKKRRRRRKHLNQERVAEPISTSKLVSVSPVEEETVRPLAANLEQEFDDKAGTKGRRRMKRKAPLPIDSEVNATALRVDVVKENGSCDYKRENVFHPTSEEETSNVSDKVQMDARKRRTQVKASSGKDAVEESNHKKSSNKHDRHLVGSLVPKVKKCTLDDEASEKNKDSNYIGENLVGRIIKVYWPMDKRFYEGVVNSFDPSTKKHQILYLDGDEESLYLNKELWEEIPDNSSPVEGRKTGFTSPPSRSKKRKSFTQTDHLGKQRKSEPSLKSQQIH